LEDHLELEESESFQISKILSEIIRTHNKVWREKRGGQEERRERAGRGTKGRREVDRSTEGEKV
jgi:hypothetical protein